MVDVVLKHAFVIVMACIYALGNLVNSAPGDIAAAGMEQLGDSSGKSTSQTTKSPIHDMSHKRRKTTLIYDRVLIDKTKSITDTSAINLESETEHMKKLQNRTRYNSQTELINPVQRTPSYIYVPDRWRRVCAATLNGNDATNVTITCNIGRSDSLNFVTFRNFTSKIREKVLFSLKLNCYGGEINLPRHARAKLLSSLIVSGCRITGYFTEARDYNIDLIPDDMVYYAVINSRHMMTKKDFSDSLKTANYSKTFQCGPLNAREIITRNFSTGFVNLDTFDITEENLFALGTTLHRHHQKISIKCDYENLLYYEKSFLSSLAIDTLQNDLQDAVYPNIQVFNFSSCGLFYVPPVFKNWRKSHKNLKYLDLTRNAIKEIGDIRNHASRYENPNIGTIDLRYNYISILQMRHIEPLMEYNLLTVDIRNNPFNCICEMKDFIEFVRKNFTDMPKRYKYLSNLTCHTPLFLRGKVISKLSLEQIGCEILKTSILKVPLVVLCSFIVVLSVSIVLGIRYRKEIIILTYTRLNILLPCQQRGSDADKQFDAFIAYSEADTSWVVHTLSKRLENPENAQRFYLCLHHRDFIVGAAISDNIIQSVENSRHTVIIVSKNFLKSEWCRLEFRTALHQSLLEKKRHLIIVLLEDIPSSEFEPELKRCMQTLTYVKVDDKWFWDKLVYALSDWSKRPRKRRTASTKSNTSNRKDNRISANTNKQVLDRQFSGQSYSN